VGKILRDPGAVVFVGLLGFATSFMGIGLAIAALDLKGDRLTVPVLGSAASVAFGIGAALYILAIPVTLYIFSYAITVGRRRERLSEYLRQAYRLRTAIFEEWSPELQASTTVGDKANLLLRHQEQAKEWMDAVQRWLDEKLLDQAADFGLETM